MIWTDIIIEDLIPDWRLRKAFQNLLNIPLDKIQIIEEYDDFPDANTMNVVCQKSLFPEGFVMIVSIYLFGEITKNMPNIDKFVSEFSILSNSRCLIPTDNEDPYQMILFEGTKKDLVYIDENILENDEIYTLKK